ncbi:NADH-quinone oxidoreductase subunit J [Phormidium tenue]|uniref:NADH-quinone oxidoreductase subunit J n=1 Tax=Phormidium tenue NIES-30 TaxID=549789 RepID=A0A1U7JA48_9CYAN|nr:NADH-quinone oxidoreductase subunit J [Phormidium tenue]MBD2230611.1 NADH-quinone oxidoreductase subunit J [Phormidium tenue FACHB-1052]OKH50623.1 NADH:ubiquinone oxidoreductase subunit J [Phormidium tenue NIES-30]
MTLAEGVQLVAFGILVAMTLGGALGVVLLDNIVYSAFLLGGVFTSMSGLYILLNAGFVAAAQVLVYVGAVSVLILFGIMLVNKEQQFAPIKQAWVGKIATAGVCVGLFALLTTSTLNTPWAISTEVPQGENATVAIGIHFFTDYLLPFELASVLLLIALIGAIVLARRELIPDVAPGEAASEALQLPERPRELVSSMASPESD